MNTPPTLADEYARGSMSPPQYAAPPPLPQPRRDSDATLWLGSLAGVALVTGLFLFRDPIAVRVFGPPPMFAVVSQTCEPEVPELEGGLNPMGIVGSAVRALVADRTVISEVHLRNSGGAGAAHLVVEMAQSKAPRQVIREETVWLEQGEERALEFQFPEYVARAEARCGSTITHVEESPSRSPGLR